MARTPSVICALPALVLPLSTTWARAIGRPFRRDVPFFQADLRQTDTLREILASQRIDCVMHFAALACVGESVAEPMRYYSNNVGGTLSLLEAMQSAGVRRIVFSSTCAVIGLPSVLPIVETSPPRADQPLWLVQAGS